ncbi:MAG: PQQ-dependent sugar dehydrogenase [Gemmatimonadales bacterium]
MSRTLAILLAGMVACRPPGPNGPALRSPNPSAQRNALKVETVARGLEHPWALAFLPDGRILVTERPGRLRIVEPDGRLSSPLAGVPAVHARGQGGLLDVALDPDFSSNQTIYLSYAEPGAGGLAGTAVAQARLGAAGLEDLRVIYRQEPKVAGGGHFGSRLVFDRSGALFVTQGDRFDYRDQAQNLSSGLGKMVRIMPDGSIPRDNPFAGQSGTRREIWSYGHRNIQAAALDPATGQLWTVEHGARGGDELNHPEAGKNYGWPVITYGRDYSGLAIGEGTAKEGMEQPVYYWDPIIAPSGMVFYSGDAFPDWKGNILVGGLASQVLVRLVLENGAVVREERYLGELGWRIRDVQEGPDGALYVVTDEADGRVLRILPGSR